MKLLNALSLTLFFLALLSKPVYADCVRSNSPPGDNHTIPCTDNGNLFWCSQSTTECSGMGSGVIIPPPKSFLKDVLNNLNPIKIANLDTLPGIVNAVVPILITLAGLILFIMLIAGGFGMLTSATNPEAADKSKQRITNALTGFLIIFVAYWLTQIIEIILGVKILGP